MNGFSAPAVLSLFIALFMRLPSLIDISRRGANANPLFWAAKSHVMNRSHRTKVLSSQISVLDCMIAVHSWLSRLLAPGHFSRIEKVGCGAILYVHWKLVRKSIWCESRISTSLACRTASQQASDCLEWALHYDKSPLLYQIWPALAFFPRWMTLGLLLCIQLYSDAGFGFFQLRLWILIVGWHTCVRPHASCQLSNLSQYLYTTLDLLVNCIGCAQFKNTGRRQHCHFTMMMMTPEFP